MLRLAVSLLTLVLIALPACKSPQPKPLTSQPTGDDPMTSVNTLLPAPADYAAKRVGSDEYPLPPYAKFLKGVKICLDPGHGGDAHKRGFKRGPTGVREAEMNLRVGQYLREFLTAAGAEVKLTREGDNDLELAARAGVANDWGADLFVSLHHNAIDNKPDTNYTTVWYHGQVDDRPSKLDLARYLCQALYDGLKLPNITAVPLKTDLLMYQSGFGVLRAAEVTACLTETSFYTNPDEEQRLRDPAYNLREAYSVFLGLARYAAAGLPRARLVSPADGTLAIGADVATPTLEFALDDGLRGRKAWGHEKQMILSDSIVVRVDGQVVPHQFTNEGYRLTIPLATLSAGADHTVEVRFQNMYKNHNLDGPFKIRVAMTGRV